MSLLKQNREKFEAKAKKNGNEKIKSINDVSLESSFLPIIKKIVIFFLFQLIFLPLSMLFSTKIPFIGTILRYCLEGVSQAAHYFEILDLTNEITTSQEKIEYLEDVNRKLKKNLTTIESDHPELFGNIEEKTNWRRWITGTIVVTIAAMSIKYLFFGSSGATTAFIGAKKLLDHYEETNIERHKATLKTVEEISNTLMENAQTSEAISNQVQTLSVVAAALLTQQQEFDLNFDAARNNEEEVPTEFLSTPKDKKQLTFINSKKPTPSLPKINNFSLDDN